MNLVNRSSWDARAPKCSSPLPPIDTIVFHYTASHSDRVNDHIDCFARLRGIQRYHMDTQGWCDIAYNWLVCQHGYVFEGRGWVKSAATGAANSHTIAVCFLGADKTDRDDLTDLGRQALVDAAKMVQTKVGKKLACKGHRDFMSTSCPGNELQAFIRSSGFYNRVNQDIEKRRATLRAWILARRTAGWTWARIKQTANWREFKRLGGR